MDSDGSEGDFNSSIMWGNRAPMSSSDVTGLLIGLPNAWAFSLQCTIQRGESF